jgi:hypothetical protein
MNESRNYAVVQDGLVINTILWDGIAEWAPPEGSEAIPVPDGETVGTGYAYAGGVFTAPPPPPIMPPTAAETLASNTAMRNQLLAAATLAIAPLQDADDLGEATVAESALLKAWKQFRVAVNRIDLTQQGPSWPAPPQAGYGAVVSAPGASSS